MLVSAISSLGSGATLTIRPTTGNDQQNDISGYRLPRSIVTRLISHSGPPLPSCTSSMAPKLRISVSRDTAYPPTHPIEINTTTPTKIKTEGFEGEIRVWIKGYNGDANDGEEYFDHVHERGEKRNLTYAISLRGALLSPPVHFRRSSDDTRR